MRELYIIPSCLHCVVLNQAGSVTNLLWQPLYTIFNIVIHSRLNLSMPFKKAVSLQSELKWTSFQQIFQIRASQHGPPEKTVPLFFHYCKRDRFSDCLSTAVVLLFALWSLPGNRCIYHNITFWKTMTARHWIKGQNCCLETSSEFIKFMLMKNYYVA